MVTINIDFTQDIYFENSFFGLKSILKFRYFAAVVVSLAVSSTAFAAGEGEVIFNDNGCNSCHAVAKKSVGPSIREIVTKYAGDKQAQVRLEEKVRRGGAGSFGTTSMPPIIEPVSDGEIKSVVGWILSQKLEQHHSYD